MAEVTFPASRRDQPETVPVNAGGQMGTNRRTAIRRDLRYPADLIAGDTRSRCTVSDVSAGGASIETAAAPSLPDEVIICFSVTGPLCRVGRVIWRRESRVGLEWVRRISKETCGEQQCPVKCREPEAGEVTLVDA
ncbi:PilZ domain-containing protein [Blastochloris sulfoviridis]|uniref:PilZ domain-containing protein n=1 Tax=Blastochloris sulfoviridis TaxID=50712 RepID=A0A5M6HLK6_9HYPH|nr:PilZ domain-containing protein [Blastochloris sulfoviridis]KAA5596742.1 PilZ domain-containing protein [Blastochloris sulfoviridis]